MTVGEGPNGPGIELGKRTHDRTGEFSTYHRDPALEDLAQKFSDCDTRWKVINHLRVFLHRKWLDANGGSDPPVPAEYKRTYGSSRLSAICEQIQVTHPRTAHLDFDWFGNRHWWGNGVADGDKLEIQTARALLEYLERSMLPTASDPPEKPDSWIWPSGTDASLNPWQKMDRATTPGECKPIRLVWEWSTTATSVSFDITKTSAAGEMIFRIDSPVPQRWDWLS